MNYIFFDTKRNYENLLPLTYTRPVSEIRIGIMTIKEKWEKLIETNFSNLTQDYLQEKFPVKIDEENILINSSVLPNDDLISEIKRLKLNSFLKKDNLILAVNLDYDGAENFQNVNFLGLTAVEYYDNVTVIENLWDIFSLNGQEIEIDFKILTKNRISKPISRTNKVFNEENIFIEEGAEVECAVLNAKDGYIYIGKDAVVMENVVIRGSLALCEHSQLKVGAVVYGPTTIGPFSKFGGEINNSVVFGYSNKAHDGFLGNSVIGEWCNIGAGSNNSNLKNNYEEVKLWNYRDQKFVKTGLQFCGLIMGDHSKCAINTMFNTGTVVGVSSNIYGAGFPRNFVSSFSWGGAHGFVEYNIQKALATAQKVVNRRGIELSDVDKNILQHVFDLSVHNRK
ncbi:MAG: GlmU family protein [Bacteroidales bacterium]|nr:GlmU family protein [Bacteroidales bacterium]